MAIYLIDYENQPNITGFSSLKENDKVFIFYSNKAKTISFDQHFDINKSKAKIEYINAYRPNKVSNALDFQLIFYFGWIAKNYENEDFYIVSTDNGYKSLKVMCANFGINYKITDSLKASTKSKITTKKADSAEIADGTDKETVVTESISPTTEILESDLSVAKTEQKNAQDKKPESLECMLKNSGINLTDDELNTIVKLHVPSKDLMGALKKHLAGDEEKAKKVKCVIDKHKRKSKKRVA